MNENFVININNQNFEIKNVDENILEIYLYGSVARNENDEYSDLDIFILCKNKNVLDKEQLAKKLKIKSNWISVYEMNAISLMLEEGSLFLWHLKKEGKKLYSKNDWFTNKLKVLGHYCKVGHNLFQYKEILKDIKKSVKLGLNTYIYEYSLIATLIRNIAILHCYINKEYLFGRESAFLKSQDLRKDKEKIPYDLYKEIYKYRFAYRDNSDVDLLDLNIDNIIKLTENYIEEVTRNYEQR